LPQTLADVLHFFLPELEAGEGGVREDDDPPRRRATNAWPLIGVPLGDHDVVRAAFVWNLAVEFARTGTRASVVAPADAAGSALWPEAGRGPLDTELVLATAGDVSDLANTARDLASTRAAETGDQPGVVFVRLPASWLAKPADAAPLLERVLLFATPDPHDLLDAYAVAKRVMTAAPFAHVGVTLHGARSLSDARHAFIRLAGATERQLGRELASYGVIAGDLDIYRSILHRRAIGLDHPQGAAARSMADVARLVIGDLVAGGQHG
jgi:hypothetical protein